MGIKLHNGFVILLNCSVSVVVSFFILILCMFSFPLLKRLFPGSSSVSLVLSGTIFWFYQFQLLLLLFHFFFWFILFIYLLLIKLTAEIIYFKFCFVFFECVLYRFKLNTYVAAMWILNVVMSYILYSHFCSFSSAPHPPSTLAPFLLIPNQVTLV